MKVIPPVVVVPIPVGPTGPAYVPVIPAPRPLPPPRYANGVGPAVAETGPLYVPNLVRAPPVKRVLPPRASVVVPTGPTGPVAPRPPIISVANAPVRSLKSEVVATGPAYVPRIPLPPAPVAPRYANGTGPSVSQPTGPVYVPNLVRAPPVVRKLPPRAVVAGPTGPEAPLVRPPVVFTESTAGVTGPVYVPRIPVARPPPPPRYANGTGPSVSQPTGPVYVPNLVRAPPVVRKLPPRAVVAGPTGPTGPSSPCRIDLKTLWVTKKVDNVILPNRLWKTPTEVYVHSATGPAPAWVTPPRRVRLGKVVPYVRKTKA